MLLSCFCCFLLDLQANMTGKTLVSLIGTINGT